MYHESVEDPDDIERELIEAQAGVKAARAATLRRQAAVSAALAAGWTKYRIAKVLGVNAPTVDSIIEAVKRAQATQEGSGQ